MSRKHESITVGELIKELNKYPKDHDVFIPLGAKTVESGSGIRSAILKIQAAPNSVNLFTTEFAVATGMLKVDENNVIIRPEKSLNKDTNKLN